MSVKDTAVYLGARVRELRLDRGLTLKALGRQAGLSHPFLSQLERGLARPSVASVERIAQALQVPVGSLWAERHRGAARVVRADEATVVPHLEAGAPGTVRELLVNGTMRVREWSGGGRNWPEEAESTTGDVVVYVIRGAIEVELDGAVHGLAAGDVLRFDGAVPHRVRRSGPPTTRALYVAAG